MTTTYEFPFYFTKLGVGTFPSVDPTVSVIDKNNNLLISAQACTKLTNLAGSYYYSYSGADDLTCWAVAHTTDATMDAQDLSSYTPTKIYKLDDTVTSRLASASYVSPDNTTIGLIDAKTTNLPIDPASNTVVNTRMATFTYTAPDNTTIALIDAKTTNLPSNPASQTNLDVAVSTRSSHTAADVWTSTTRTLSSFGTLVADIWANTVRTLTTTVAGLTAQEVWEYTRRTLTSSATPVSPGSTTNGTYQWLTQEPGKLDITMRLSDDLSFDVLFGVDLTDFTYEANIFPLTVVTSTDIPITITVNDITTGNLHFYISHTSIKDLPIFTDRHKWSFYWVNSGIKRTILGGYFNLEGV